MSANHAIRGYDGATAIITGGASGIGRALGEELAKRGCEVTLADLQSEMAENVASEICAAGGKAEAKKLDVVDFSAVEAVVQDTVTRTGRLDYMFNNAGIALGGEIHHYRIEDWDRVIDINLRGVIHGVHAAYTIMRNQGFGHIVNTASMAGLGPMPFAVGYATAKHAVVGLSKSLRAEVAQEGIRVSVICPGVIRTPILDGGKYGSMLADIPPRELLRLWERLRPMPADIFARKVLGAVSRNRAIIIYPSWWRVIWYMNRLSPLLGIFLARKSSQDTLKKFEKMK